jgi:hypothetical protein
MSLLLVDLQNLYRQTFGSRPRIPDRETGEDLSRFSGSQLLTEHMGKEIWLPVRFVGLPSEFGMSELLLPYTTVKITGKKTIIKTALSERKGTVKELFSIDDYKISIKGFVIDDKKRVWPEAELSVLKRLWELNESVRLDNALTNVFLNQDRVVIESIDLPEVEGGRKHIRPISMQLESDSIFELNV